MKRIFLLVVGWYLIFQAGLGVLIMFGQPQNAAVILLISGLCGWGGYKLITIARASRKENQPTAELQAPETNRLDRK